MLDAFIYISRQTILLLVYVMDAAFLVRAVLSFIDPMQESKFSAFMYAFTEPIILPMRKLCEKMHWFEGFPLDMPFFLTSIILAMISTIL